MTLAYLSWSVAGVTNALRFDAVTTETHTFANQVTEQPVERGANVVDHVRPSPDSLTLDVVVSNAPVDAAPLRLGGAQRGDIYPTQLSIPSSNPPAPYTPGYAFSTIGATIDALVAQVSQPPTIQTLRFFNEFDAVSEVYATIKQLRDSGQLINVITPLNNFDNMVITNVTVPRDVSNGDALLMTIDFRQVRIVETRQTTEPVPTETRGKRPKAAGVKGDKEDGGKKKKSVAKSIVDSLGGLLGNAGN